MQKAKKKKNTGQTIEIIANALKGIFYGIKTFLLF